MLFTEFGSHKIMVGTQKFFSGKNLCLKKCAVSAVQLDACVFYIPILSYPYNFSSASTFLRFLGHFFKFPYIGKYAKTDPLKMLLPELRNV